MSERPSAPSWPEAPGDPALVEARLQAHHAAQLLAAFAGRFLEPRDDDAHRSLCWLPERQALATGSSSRDGDAVAVCLGLRDLRLSLLRGDDEIDSLDLHGRTLDEARTWLRDHAMPGESDPLSWPEYDIPPHAVGSGLPFDLDPRAAARLTKWFAAAAWALAPVADRSDASPVRCWPHHFDIATLISLPTPDAEGRTPAVGVGMTPGDGAYSAPYGYVSPWPPPWDRPRPTLLHGHWHVEGWIGAVLPAETWANEEGPSLVSHFFTDAIEASLALLR